MTGLNLGNEKDSNIKSCGIEGMLSYLCMTDKDVMMDEEVTDIKGFDFNEELKKTEAIQNILDDKYCTKLFYVDFNNDNVGNIGDKLKTLKDLFRAALDAEYRWTIVIDKDGKKPNDVNVYATNSALKEIAKPDDITHYHFVAKLLFCEQYSIKRQAIPAMTEKQIIRLNFHPVFRKSCPKEHWIFGYFVKKTKTRVRGVLQIAFWAAFEQKNLVDTKQDTKAAYAKCKPRSIGMVTYIKKEYEKCGILETLQYLCLTDTDATGPGQGYYINNDPNWNQGAIRADPDRKQLKELLERCDKIYYDGSQTSSETMASGWLNVMSDAGYKTMVLIVDRNRHIHKKPHKPQGNYCTEEVIVETMDDREKNLYVDMLAYFCKPPNHLASRVC